MTIPILHPFQAKLRGEVEQNWNQGAWNVIMRLDTGGGKTVTLSDIIRSNVGESCVIAHRQELVGQLSLTLARYGVRHNIIAAEATRRAIARLHVEELGKCFYDPGALCTVASIDTLVRAELPRGWAARVTLWVVDEAHHLVLDNKWHRGISLFTNEACKGLMPTATPIRADRKGLGRPALGGHGVADVMVEGPPMRWLIDQGYLTDYRIICPPSDLEILDAVGASGDWSSKQLREAAKRSHIVGDVVRHYKHWAAGKLGITFSTDVETAIDITAAFRAAGVRAETLTGKTDDAVRRSILRQFSRRQIDQIVAVDIVSEGFDLPAIEVASMARPTQSLSLYMQQFGRALRRMEGKGKAIIIDHAANVIRHRGPPDKPRIWTLESTGKAGGPSDAIPLRVCMACYEPYERFHKDCPHCGASPPPPDGRSSPIMVDGDMGELDPELLRRLRGEIDEVDKSPQQLASELSRDGRPHVWAMGDVKRHNEKQAAQRVLREAMARWGGYASQRGLTDVETQKLFFLTFKIDVMTAQTLAPKDAHALREKITVDRTVNRL